MSQADAPAADWYPDPSGRFQFRYWDGESWTGHVSTDGNTDWDPPEEAAADAQQSGDDEGQDSRTQDSGTQDSGSQDGAAQDRAEQHAEGQPDGDGVGQPAATTVPPKEPEPATGDDSAYAPGGQAQSSEPSSGAQQSDAQQSDAQQSEVLSGQTVRIDQAQLPATTPPESSADAPPQTAQPQDAQSQGGAAAGGAAQGGTIEEGEPSDTNLVANQRADVDDDVKAWLDEVAAQVSPRLSRINREWTSQPQAEAARACAYGLLVGHLAHLHPHMRDDLSEVAEAHPSFTTLEDGARLDTLEQIARDPQRTAAWLGPLIATEDADKVQTLFD